MKLGVRWGWPEGLTLALLTLAAALLFLLGTRFLTPYTPYGTTYDAPPAAPALSGTDQDGRSFSLASLRGQTVALFFGFTHCPDVCPLTLTYLERARQELPQRERKNFRVVLVSVDPARDTPAKLRDYVRFFGPGITGVNVPEPDLKKVAAAYGVWYTKTNVRSKNDYNVDHTSAVILIDAEGRRRLVWDSAQLPDLPKVGADLRQVLRD